MEHAFCEGHCPASGDHPLSQTLAAIPTLKDITPSLPDLAPAFFPNPLPSPDGALAGRHRPSSITSVGFQHLWEIGYNAQLRPLPEAPPFCKASSDPDLWKTKQTTHSSSPAKHVSLQRSGAQQRGASLSTSGTMGLFWPVEHEQTQNMEGLGKRVCIRAFPLSS